MKLCEGERECEQSPFSEAKIAENIRLLNGAHDKLLLVIVINIRQGLHFSLIYILIVYAFSQ